MTDDHLANGWQGRAVPITSQEYAARHGLQPYWRHHVGHDVGIRFGCVGPPLVSGVEQPSFKQRLERAFDGSDQHNQHRVFPWPKDDPQTLVCHNLPLAEPAEAL